MGSPAILRLSLVSSIDVPHSTSSASSPPRYLVRLFVKIPSEAITSFGHLHRSSDSCTIRGREADGPDAIKPHIISCGSTPLQTDF